MMKNAVNFLYEVKAELSKVVWPKREEFVGATIIVLVFVCISAIYLGLLDFLFSRLMWYIFSEFGGH